MFGGQFSGFDLLQHILDQIGYLIHIGIHFAKQSQRLRQVLLDVIVIDCLLKRTEEEKQSFKGWK